MKNTKKKYEVWIEKQVSYGEFVEIEMDTVFSGSKTACQKYYNSNGGSHSGLHLGYVVKYEDENE